MAGRPWCRRGVGRLLALLLVAGITGTLIPATVPAPHAAAVDLAPAAERLDPSLLLPPLLLPGVTASRAAQPAANASLVDSARLPDIEAPAPAARQLARPLLGVLLADDGLAPPETPAADLSLAATASRPLAVPDAQNLQDQATLETRRPEVQWSAAGSDDWQTVPSRETVRGGDRVRTGADASARVVYFEGSVTELSANTGVLVQRLERTEGGNIVTNLFQSVGTTVSRVVQLVDPAAGFQVETPAATAYVRGTAPRVEVGRDGRTIITNVPDGTEGLVNVQGKDQAGTVVVLLSGQETQVVPGLPPSSPASQGTFSFATGPAPPLAAALQQQQEQRQQQRHQQQQAAQQQAALAENGLTADQAELNRLTQQEQALQQQILQLLNPTATPGISSQPPPGSRVTPIPLSQARPCGAVGQTCTSTITQFAGSGVSGTAA